ncbi:MAG: hypothetical protein EB058_16010, partial [Proteobacteria bacterium]|nr:hypothetical protein [Pseudomonadota bacterium]
MTVTVTASEALSAVPVISIDQPGTTDIASESTSGSGPYTYAYTVVAANAGTYADGTATVTVSGTDMAGNTGTTVTSGGTFAIDTTAPSVALTYAISSSVPANATAAGNLTFSSSLSRPVKVGDIVVVKAVTTEATGLASALSLALDGGRAITALETYTASSSVGTTYFTHTVASGNDGTVTVSVTGPDTAGNAAVASGTTTFAIDTTAPSVALTYSIGASAYSDSVSRPVKTGDTVTIKATMTEVVALSAAPTITLTATGGVTTVTATPMTQVGSSLVYTYAYAVQASEDGTVSASVSATDTAGNALASAAVTAFTVDNTAPTVTSITRANSQLTNASPVFTVTFSESVSGAVAANFTASKGSGISGTGSVSVSGSG